MAIRERKGRASPWQVYWNNPFTGKRECANFVTKEEALEADSLVKHRLKFDRESFRKEEEENCEGSKEITLEDAYLLYLQEKQFTKRNLSCQLYAMRQALNFLGDRELSSITIKDLEALQIQIKKTGVKNVTVAYRMKKIKTLLRWCAEKEYCNPIGFPRLPTMYYEKFVPPSQRELFEIMSVAPEHIQRVIILGSQCGVRVGTSELLKMLWQDVDLEQRLVRIQGAKKNMSAQWREVPLKDSLIPLFTKWRNEDYKNDCEYVINYRYRPIQSIKTSWKTTLQRAGITRRIRPYDLRHAFATELIAYGADIGTVSKLLGHSSPTMLLNHYQYVLDKQKKSAIDLLPDFKYVPSSMCPKS